MGLTLKQAKVKYLEAKQAYYAGSPIMSDATFDRLEDWIQSKDPNWKGFSTGVKVGKKTEVRLPQYLPSLAKCYPEQIDSWFDKFVKLKWAYMAKLDGCSVYLEYQNGKPSRLITRGDGEYGKDISFFIPYLSIPKTIKYKDILQLRCEALLTKESFETKWSEEFDASRNMVSGLLNRQTPHEALKDIHFVVLGIYNYPLYDGLRTAFNLGFETVYCRLDQPRAQCKHYDLVKQGKYDCDGVVICDPEWVYKYTSADKPKSNIIAYKENVEFADSEVVNIIYQTSSAGRIIPKIQIKPVMLAGAMIEYCTSHNAKWMIDRGIGVGAKVRITRSGEVIPKIIDVLHKGEIVYPDCKYTMKGVHFIACSLSKEQVVRMLDKFVTSLGIESVKARTLSVLYDCGVTSIHKLLILLNQPNLESRLQAKFGKKKGLIIYDSLSRIVNERYPIAKLMIASCVFNTIGEKRLNALQELDFDLLSLSTWDINKIKHSIISPGIGELVAEQIAQGLVDFDKFYRQNKKYIKKPLPYTKKKIVNGCLTGLNISFTGYRSKEQEDIIINNGGNIISFGSKTSVLLYSRTGKRSSKVDKAKDKAMVWEQFCKRYNVA